jgi:surface protein
MSVNLTKPLRLRNDGGAQLQLERSGTTRSLTVNASGNLEVDGALNVSGAITAPTSTNTINGVVIDSGVITGTVAYDNSTSNLTATNVQAAIDEVYFNTIQYVVHGTNSNVARPAGFPVVYWRGTAIPANPIDGDFWDETQTFFSPDAGLWVYDGTIRLWVKGTDTVSVDWVSDHTVGAGGSVELNFGTSSGDRTIDWGDGSTPVVVNTARPAHTYTNAGTYQVRASGGTTIRLGDRGASTVAAWTDTLQRVRSWGNLGWTNFQNGLQAVSGNFGVPRYVPSTVTNMAAMFRSASAFNQPIGSWNTGSVTNMLTMFNGASAFNQPIGSWNTANVTDMASMFFGASAFNQPIGAWNTAKVTDLSDTFRNAAAFNQDISGWNVSAVSSMLGTFRRTADSVAFNQDLGAWQLRLAGVDMTSMFAGALSLSTENYSRTLIGWANYVSANSDTPANVTLGGGTRTYNATAYVSGQTYNDAVAARAYLVGSPPDWIITDGGQV